MRIVSAPAPTTSLGPDHRRRVRVGTLVGAAVLIPTLALVGVLGGSMTDAWREHRAADGLQSDVDELSAIVESRSAVGDEQLATSLLAAAADLDLAPSDLEAIYGVDPVEQLETARARVDADPVLAAEPRFAEHRSALDELRQSVDADAVGLEEVAATMLAFTGEVDDLWTARLAAVLRSDARGELPAGSRARLDVLRHAHLALVAANERTQLGRLVLREGASAGEVAELLAADGRYLEGVAGFEGELGPHGLATWEELSADAEVDRFEQTLELATQVAASGAAPPLAESTAAFAEAFAGATQWSELHIALVQAAATDLSEWATDRADAANRTLVLRAVTAVLLVAVSFGAAALVARSLVRPVQRLGAAAREVRDGRLDGSRLDIRGPRELAEAASAFNDMTTTLAAIEEQAVILAEDPGRAEVPEQLPGRTGQALHTALERLRQVIVVGERRRDELQERSVRDPLTGLLNRSAALDALARRLAAGERDDRPTAVLFIDLDGLKQINDGHGHEAGDVALRTVADALRATTRDADAVARYGGDEFLVSGAAGNLDEVEALAERVRQEVRSSPFVHHGHVLAVSCSIGVAVAAPGTVRVDELVARADAAVYEAKRAGRDRVAWASMVGG